ncbi:MAG: AMP-binding protein [Thermodesulfobacteriota bacterium]|nr:AMP-binding protein [Thermodesulfobacteriota bacterium]
MPEKRNQKALIFEKGDHITEFSNFELKKTVCQWAGALVDQGLSPGDRLFIYLPSSPEICLAILACSRLGVIFSPLYATPGYEELAERIQDAEPRGILTHPDRAERLPVEIMAFLKGILSPDMPLKEIEFLDKLPKTSSGKLLCRVLRMRELGLPTGNPLDMKD